MSTDLGRAMKGIRRAKRWLQGAQRSIEDKRWDDCVYCSQMASEQSIKALLLHVGLIFKRVHDVSDYFLTLQEDLRFSKEFRKIIPKIADNLVELTEQRNLAGYGFEEGIEEDYFESYAPEALDMAKEIVEQVEIVLISLIKSDKSKKAD